MGDFRNVGIAVLVWLGLAVMFGFVKAWWKDRLRARDLAAIPAVAKVLAVEPGSRFNVADWKAALTELHQAGFSLEDSVDLFRRMKVFWRT